MKKIVIVTDSTTDLDQSLIDKHHIEVIPLTIHIDGETYTDGVDITPEIFMKKMAKSSELPKSSQPAVGKFVETYQGLLQKADQIISIHLTSGMSGTFQTAESAAEMAGGDITVIDSQFISKALGFQVLEAAKMAENGFSKEEILNRIQQIKEVTKLFVTVDTLDNLVKGGRIGRGKAMIGSLLNIKPIASLQDGVYTPVAKVRSHSQIVKYLAKQFADDVKGKTAKAIGIAHADASELAHNLKDALLQVRPDLPIDISFTTPVVSTHTGPGAIGFMYYTE
ncbi:DegV family protein [Metabacillus sp. 113a]|uniref:DegV family protein n=1 Tax=Metabacillus sp. 113a TaxID=3404706 RepID=UPI003CEFE941